MRMLLEEKQESYRAILVLKLKCWDDLWLTIKSMYNEDASLFQLRQLDVYFPMMKIRPVSDSGLFLSFLTYALIPAVFAGLAICASTLV